MSTISGLTFLINFWHEFLSSGRFCLYFNIAAVWINETSSYYNIPLWDTLSEIIISSGRVHACQTVYVFVLHVHVQPHVSSPILSSISLCLNFMWGESPVQKWQASPIQYDTFGSLFSPRRSLFFFIPVGRYHILPHTLATRRHTHWLILLFGFSLNHGIGECFEQWDFRLPCTSIVRNRLSQVTWYNILWYTQHCVVSLKANYTMLFVIDLLWQ